MEAIQPYSAVDGGSCMAGLAVNLLERRAVKLASIEVIFWKLGH